MIRLSDAEVSLLADGDRECVPGAEAVRSLALEVREVRERLAAEKAEREAEDREGDEQWDRIKAMTPEQLDATIVEAGFDLADVKREASHTKKWCDALIREKERTAKAEAELVALRARVAELGRKGSEVGR